ncbi:MAG: T9SS type A sorting domain-containing protein [Paludibacter sp.]
MKTKILLLLFMAFTFRSLMAADVVLNDFEAGSPVVTPLYGASYLNVPNPNLTGNPSANCGQVARTTTQWWEMINFPVNFTVLPNTSQYVHVLVNYLIQPFLSIQINNLGEINQSNAYTKLGQWQDVVFEVKGGTAGLTVTSLSIETDRNIALAVDAFGYFDNVILNDDPLPKGASYLTGNNLYDFEPKTAANITSIKTYASINDTISYPVANPFRTDANKTANCGKRVATATAQWWSGFEFKFVNPVLVDSKHNYLHFMVTVPYDYQNILYSVGQGASYVIKDQVYSVYAANTWEDVVIDVSALTFISGMRIECGHWDITIAGNYYFDEIYLDDNPNQRTSVTAISNPTINGDCKIYASNKTINIENRGEAKFATIYNANGQKVLVKQINSIEKILINNAGLYFVSIGNHTTKLIIK